MMGIELAGAETFVADPALARLVGAPESIEVGKLTGTLPPGTRVESNGELVDFGNGTRNVFGVDPSGMNLELFERPEPAAR